MQINMQLMNVGRLADRNKVKYAVTGWCLATSNYLLTYLLTYSMEQSLSWEANWSAASQEIPRILWNPKTSNYMGIN